MSDQQITNDLMAKVSIDVERTIKRTLDIAPDRYPIVLAAACSVLGILTAEIAHRSGRYRRSEEPDNKLIMLSALIVARSGMGLDDPGRASEDDFSALQNVGRI